MRFVVDAQLPPALARMLAEEGHQAEHVVDFTKANAPDGEIWQYALSITAAIVTKDEDFVIQASITSLSPPIVWIRTGNLGKQALLSWFQPLIPREALIYSVRGEYFPFTPSIHRATRGTQGERKMYRTTCGLNRRLPRIVASIESGEKLIELA